MNSIRSEWPLLVFTTCAPLCVGAWIVAASLVLSGMAPGSAVLTTGAYGGFLGALLLASLVCSTLHLGKPTKALRAFMRLGNSTVSNEVFVGALFTTALMFYVAVSHSLANAVEILGTLLVLVTAFAILFVVFQCLAYRMRTVPTWNSFAFSVDFAVIALLGGVCLEGVLACLAFPVSLHVRTALVVIEAACCMAVVFVVYAQGTTVTRSTWAGGGTSSWAKQWSTLGTARILTTLAGSILWGFGMLASQPSMPAIIVGATIVVAGIVVGRYAFYRFYVNVGLPRS
ncbi:dimethyl sulfoxide reductase anchor subunit [Paraeggerthella hongkongensis]|uniref:dimethyl sulfoxide reductase anchor subunit family protein n=1 Tax=Paraeggerthella hominis TaxID=2897351 RepID=UPI001C0FC599|nr:MULTISPECIES: DmsC/YnfH family molybdoenzyme membrane anchor subunit [Paraeggerthella]MBU5405940.1 dimethyl sulfoxide reductase anchor subunit [Paraeggerthella hongkongensis]MCD2433788.1 dimethyl sulfoxide reductase anchor subunit [Paraeggerthella hominis]